MTTEAEVDVPFEHVPLPRVSVQEKRGSRRLQCRDDRGRVRVLTCLSSRA